jgi:hypothetical protein
VRSAAVARRQTAAALLTANCQIEAESKKVGLKPTAPQPSLEGDVHATPGHAPRDKR